MKNRRKKRRKKKEKKLSALGRRTFFTRSSHSLLSVLLFAWTNADIFNSSWSKMWTKYSDSWEEVTAKEESLSNNVDEYLVDDVRVLPIIRNARAGDDGDLRDLAGSVDALGEAAEADRSAPSKALPCESSLNGRVLLASDKYFHLFSKILCRNLWSICSFPMTTTTTSLAAVVTESTILLCCWRSDTWAV